jgi:hypothetical protein
MSTMISTNKVAYSATDASHGRRNRSASPLHTNGAARSARQTRVGAPGGGIVTKSSRAMSPFPTRGPRGSWCWRRMSRRAETRCRRWRRPEVSLSNFTLLFQLIQRSGICRSTTGAVGSADSRTVNVAGAGTSTASDQGDAEGAGGRADSVQVEREG